MLLDYMKISSDDAYYTTDHMIYLLDKYRMYVLKSKYESSTVQPSDQNYQTVEMQLESVDRVEGFPEDGEYRRTVNPLPDKAEVGLCTLYGGDYFSESFTWVSPQRFRFVGYNSWMKHMIYAAKGQDGRIYLKSCDPQIYYLDKLGVRAIFAEPQKVAKAGGAVCSPLDVEFPLEDNLLPLVFQYIVKELTGSAYRPKDDENNAQDDLSAIETFIRTYMKSPLTRQIENG